MSYIEHSLCMLLHMLPSNMWCNKYVMQYVFRVVVWFAWFFWKWMFSPGSVCIHIGVFNTKPKKQKRLLWHIFCDRAYKHKRCYTLVCVYSFFFFFSLENAKGAKTAVGNLMLHINENLLQEDVVPIPVMDNIVTITSKNGYWSFYPF